MGSHKCNRCGQVKEFTAAQLARYDYRCLDCERERDNARHGRPADSARRTYSNAYIPVTESGCWIWEGYWTRDGYGRIPKGQRGQYTLAHRRAWESANGATLPDGFFVCHKCDTPACVNPDHLFAGTCKDNTHDMLAKGRAKPFGRPQSERSRARFQKLRQSGGAA